MAVIALSAFQIYPAVNGGYDPANLEVRWWYNRGFVDSSTVSVQGGNGQAGFYITSTCTVDGAGIITVPSTNIFSTLDAIDPAPQSITIFGRLFSGNTPKQYVTAFSSTPTGWVVQNQTPLTYEDLVLENQAIVLANAPQTFPTFAQMIAYIDSLTPTPLASDVVIGRTELSVAPVNALIPIAVGNNDPRLGSWFNIITYGASTGNTAAQNTIAISAAVTAAKLVSAGIYIPAGTFLTNSVTIDCPCQCAPGGSILSPANSQTVLITKTFLADNSQHFANATAGLGTISFSGNLQLESVRPQWWGAVADGLTDATTAIQAAITAFPKRILFSAGSYLVTDGLLITVDDTNISGDGFDASIIKFNPATSKTCISIANGASLVSFCSIDNLSIASTNTVQKIGISLSDCSELSLSNIKINGFNSTGVNSIGVQIKGRQLNKFDRLTISADIPISIEDNPNSTLDIDQHYFANLYLVADVTQPCIKIADGVNLSDVTFEGYQSWISGKYGLYWDDTTTAVPQSYALTIKNARWEQNTDDTGYLVYISHNTHLDSLIIDNTLGGGVHGNQFYFRKVTQATISNTHYQGSLIALNADSTCGTTDAPFRFINNNWGTGTLTTTGFIFQNGTKNDGYSYQSIEVADNAVENLIFASGGGAMTRGIIAVIGAGGVSSLFYIEGANNLAVQMITNAAFTVIANNAGTTNIYHNGTRYVIQNKTGTLYAYAVYALLDAFNV